MPSRSAQICRKVAHQTHQHLWITDDVVADAFYRYARASAARQWQTESRRHGSNVPGPLEARRRLAKRRMGVVAASAASSPGHDFGALFGFEFGSSRAQLPSEKNWRWEPPESQNISPAEENKVHSGPGWPLGWLSSYPQHENWTQFLGTPNSPDQVSAVDPVHESRRIFEALLHDQAAETSIQNERLQDIVEFLQTSLDEPQAKNTLRLFEWLSPKQLASGCDQSLADLFKQKISLGTLDIAGASSCLNLVLRSNVEHVELIVSCLNALGTAECFESLCLATTKTIVDGASHNLRAGEADPTLNRWLQCLRSCEALHGFHHLSRIWQGIYAIIATFCNQSAALSQHLATLKKLDLSQVLLRHWALPTVCKANIQTMPSTRSPKAASSQPEESPKASIYTEAHTVSIEDLIAEFEGLRQQRLASKGMRTRKFSSLIDLLAVLQNNHIPHLQLARDMFQILALHTPNTVHGIFRELRNHPTLGVDPTIAADIMRYFTTTNNLQMALKVFETLPSISLHHCYDLPLKLAKHGTVSSARIFRMLGRQTPEDTVQLDDRPSANPEMSLRAETVDLVHLLAHAFAHSPHITSRVAFRRVWECFRFLQNRRAPLTSVLTRAIVHAGVIRQLRSRSWVGTAKLRWILGTVSTVEGPEIARALDHLVFRILTQNSAVQFRTRKARENVRKFWQSHPSELEQTRIRLKSWHVNGRWTSHETKHTIQDARDEV